MQYYPNIFEYFVQLLAQNGNSNTFFSSSNLIVRILFLCVVGKKTILKNVNGDFQSSKLTALVGESGCGKSTIMDVISGYRRVS